MRGPFKPAKLNISNYIKQVPFSLLCSLIKSIILNYCYLKKGTFSKIHFQTISWRELEAIVYVIMFLSSLVWGKNVILIFQQFHSRWWYHGKYSCTLCIYIGLGEKAHCSKYKFNSTVSIHVPEKNKRWCIQNIYPLQCHFNFCIAILIKFIFPAKH